MKKMKLVFLVFVVTCILSIMNVKASYLVISGITIPRFSGIYTSDEAVKDTFSNQYMKKIGAVDKNSGDGRAIEAQIQGALTGFILLNDNQFTVLPNSNSGYGEMPGTYRILLKSKKSLITEAYFTGKWVLDENLLY